jgi:hypothetical protein
MNADALHLDALTTVTANPTRIATVGEDLPPSRFPILGYALVGSIVAAMAGAFYVDAQKPPAPPPAPRPRYPRLPIPG